MPKREWVNLHVELNRRANDAATLRVQLHDAQRRHDAETEKLTAELDTLRSVEEKVSAAEAKDVPVVAEWDDLTRLSGVGPAREEQLHSAGIYRYVQVAALTPDELIQLQSKLGEFVDPTDHATWIQQAAQLMVDNRGKRC